MLQQFLEKSSQEWQTMKPGLERIQAACDAFGNPEKKIRTIHVAGTNGKGSVCAILQSVLLEAGLKVGLFTSPHLVKVNERFKIGNQEISDEELEKYLKQLLLPSHFSHLPSSLTFFELCTLIAFLYFADQNVDIAILETGLGGRLDATNVVTPIISVITEIGLDHTEILGPDIASIAREKAGIIKEGIPVVCGASKLEARRVIEEVSKARKSSVYFVNPNDNFSHPLALQGLHQIDNAKIVLKVIELFNQSVGAQHAAPVQEDAIQKGFANVRWPGRMEWISKDPPILMDGAHNLDGMRALVEYLKSETREVRRETKWRVLFSAASDKNVQEMLKMLQEISDEIVICKMKNSRSIDPEKIFSTVGAIHELPLRISHNPIQSFHEIKKSLREGEGILITGSLYFIGEMKSMLNELNQPNG